MSQKINQRKRSCLLTKNYGGEFLPNLVKMKIMGYAWNSSKIYSFLVEKERLKLDNKESKQLKVKLMRF